MRSARQGALRLSAALLAAMAVMLAAGELRAPMVKVYKDVKLSVQAIRGSKEGDAYVTASLGELGEQIKKKFGLKRVTVIGSAEIDVKSDGGKGLADLGEDLKIKIGWRAVLNDLAHFRATVMRGSAMLIDADQAIKMNASGIASAKLDKDLLVLVMTPKGDAAK